MQRYGLEEEHSTVYQALIHTQYMLGGYIHCWIESAHEKNKNIKYKYIT